MYATLVVVDGNADKRQLNIKLPTVLGRSRHADLTIAHLQVSRKHCELRQHEGVILLTDLGSLNGTFCRDRRIQRVPLLPNDQFSIGPLTFEIHYVCDANDDSEFPVDTVVTIGTLPELPDPIDLPPVELDNPIETPGGHDHTGTLARVRRARSLAGFSCREACAEERGDRTLKIGEQIEIDGPHVGSRPAAIPFDAPTSRSPSSHAKEPSGPNSPSPEKPHDEP